MYSFLYAESKLARFSGMVQETLRTSSQVILGRCNDDPIPSICKLQNWYDSICSAQNLFQKDCWALERVCRLLAYQFQDTFQGFPESVRMRSVVGSGTDSISVIFIRICICIKM